ncbi:MAG: MgtC/SapB family protein [Chloroflexi bacterium]|nr:MgtC/SapB family protein [Chloroflexota bacterium]
MLTELELTILMRAALAALLGLLIGWERKAAGAPIRARTIALAAMTVAVLTALIENLLPDEIARLTAGIMTAIGFLGAGVILRSNTGEVRGHTTAACLWAMSAIGIVIGSGHEVLGILLTLLIYTVIAWDEWPLVSRLRRQREQQPAVETRSESHVSRP